MSAARKFNLISVEDFLAGELVSTIKDPAGGSVRIGIVGKYVELEDSYKSLREALTHAGVANNLAILVDIDILAHVVHGAVVGLERGERLVVMGLNGAGKTSLMRILAEQTEADADFLFYGNDL